MNSQRKGRRGARNIWQTSGKRMRSDGSARNAHPRLQRPVSSTIPDGGGAKAKRSLSATRSANTVKSLGWSQQPARSITSSRIAATRNCFGTGAIGRRFAPPVMVARRPAKRCTTRADVGDLAPKVLDVAKMQLPHRGCPVFWSDSGADRVLKLSFCAG